MNEKVEKKKQQAHVKLTELVLEAVKAKDTVEYELAIKAIAALTGVPPQHSPMSGQNKP